MNNLIAKGKERNIDIEIFKTRNKCTDINSMNDTIKLFQISDITRYKIKAILHFSFIICLEPCPIFPRLCHIVDTKTGFKSISS